MKVLFVTFDYVPYPLFGMGVHVDDLVRELMRAGVDCKIATVNRYGIVKDSNDVICAPCLNGDSNRKKMNCSCTVHDPHCFDGLADKVFRFCEKKSWRPDLIHLHGWPMARCSRKLAEGFRVPLLSTLHFLDIQYEKMKGGHPLGKSQKPEILRREREMVLWSDRLISISSFGKKLLKAAYPTQVHKTEVIMHGIAVDKVPPRFWVRNNKIPEVTFVGRLVADEKGVEEFCEAMQPLCAAGKIKVNVLGSGILLPALRKRYGGLFNITGQIPHKEVGRYLLHSDLMVVPSLAEHFGLVVLEGMAYGAVPIVSRSGAFPEIVEDGRNGFLFSLGRRRARQILDAESIRAAVLKAVSRPKRELENIRKRNRKTVETDFSLRRMAKDTLDYYRRTVPLLPNAHGGKHNVP
ncbi:MAG: glycosyltransferase family 4 protein [Elusimicrobia bacterium]|nr:glycosyltransferase family 4 protein [Elusimicrobiota bacterium]